MLRAELHISRKSFQAVSACLLIALAWLAVYYDVVWRLVDDWRVDENYSHGFLIPVVSAYAIWTKREKMLATAAKPNWLWGGVLVILAVLMLFAGMLGAELYITRLSLVLSLAGLTVYFGGPGWLRQLLFPIGLLLFALPIPSIVFNQIAFPLQLIASDHATRAIKLFGIPALREGNVIELAQMKLQVVEACSGIRSLVSLTGLAVIYAWFAETRVWRRIILVAAVIPIAVIANAARVAGTGVLAHFQGVKAAEGFMHSFSGLVVFLVAVGLLLALAQLLNLAERVLAGKNKLLPTKHHEASRRKAKPYLFPFVSSSCGFVGKRVLLAMLLFLLSAAAFSQYLARAGDRGSAPPRTTLAEFPEQIGVWHQIDAQALEPRQLRELAADDYLSRTYKNDGGAFAYLFMAYHSTQRHRRTFHSPQNCMPGAGWTMGNHRRHRVGGRGEVNEYLIEKDGVRMLALYWYHGRGRMIASEYWARLDTIRDAMRHGRTDAALIRIIIPMGSSPVGSPDDAEQIARAAGLDFAEQILPILPSFVPD